MRKSQGSVPHLWEPLGNPCTFFSFSFFFFLLLFVIQKYQLTKTNQPENIIWYVTLLLCNGIALQSRYALHLWGVIIVTAMAIGMVTSWHRLYAKMHSTTVNRLFKVTPEKQPGKSTVEPVLHQLPSISTSTFHRLEYIDGRNDRELIFFGS